VVVWDQDKNICGKLNASMISPKDFAGFFLALWELFYLCNALIKSRKW